MTHINGTVVIIWAPGSGKTYLSEKLAESNPDHVLIHTDDFISHGFEWQLYALMEHIASFPPGTPLIIEWVGCYRLLRKWAELGTFVPDSIIEVLAPTAQLQKVYEDRPGNFAKTVSQQKWNETVYDKYKAILQEKNLPMPSHAYYDNTIEKEIAS